MISKLIVHGENRNDALRRFRRALEQYQVVGLNTNISFIKKVAEHPEFIKGEVETGFIQQYEKDLFKDAGAPDPTTLALAASALRLKEIDNIKKNSHGKYTQSNITIYIMLINLFIVDPYSPWSTHTDSFRINNINHREFAVSSNDHPYKVIVSTNNAQSQLVDMEVIDASTNESIKTFTAVDSHLDKDGLMVSSIDSKTLKSNVVLHGQDIVVFDEV